MTPRAPARQLIPHPAWRVSLAGVLAILMVGRAVGQAVYCDPAGDASPRLTDPGADGAFDPQAHQLPDLLSWSIGAWEPVDPYVDLYTGEWVESAHFFRLDLVFAGVVNPPGPLDCCGVPVFDPFRYGPNPVQGFVELDVDADVNTGGELETPELLYLGNVARYGGYPQGAAFQNRVATDAKAFQTNLATPPFVRRSGEDFRLALVGWEVIGSEIERSDTSDWLFEAGETWIVPGHFFQRAHGYRPYSSACCRAGAVIGSYDPLVHLRFAHCEQADQTTVSLVYSLTNEGSAMIAGDVEPEPPDIFYTNHNSVYEALMELKISALSASPQDRNDPEFALIAAWEHKDPADYLDPTLWRGTVLVGGSYTAPGQGALFIWSDIYPNVLPADFTGSGSIGASDLTIFNAYLNAHDGVPGVDADGTVNDRYVLINPGPNFSLFDVNNDGAVDNLDRQMIVPPVAVNRADFDQDGDVDQNDFAIMQQCMAGDGVPYGRIGCHCAVADLDGDGDVDEDDLELFLECVSGSGVPAAPVCGSPP